MDAKRALEVLRILADGVDPYTGEMFPVSSPYQHPDTVRALCAAVQSLEQTAKRATRASRAPNVGKRWTEAEDRQLCDSFVRGVGIAKLAQELGRTRGGIEARLVKLGKKEASFWTFSPERTVSQVR